VIDSGDRKRLDEACSELCELLKHPYLLQAAVLVYANKQDVKNSATSYEVKENSTISPEDFPSSYLHEIDR